MRRQIKLTIEYDGTDYHGWQSQDNAVTIQSVIEKALKKAAGHDVKIYGAGRTDAGVHALGQTASFFTGSTIPDDKFSYAVNSYLPSDIAIVNSSRVPDDFHPIKSAKGKKYTYIIYTSDFRRPVFRNRAWHIKKSLDCERMVEASGYFKGKHDFSAFMASGSSVKTTVRTIHDISLKKEGRLIYIDIYGNGFLYNMVRIITGTLVEVGLLHRQIEDIPGIIKSCDRNRAGKTAPAHGLYLKEVIY